MAQANKIGQLRRLIVLLLATLVILGGVMESPAYSQTQPLPSPQITRETAGLTLQQLGDGVYGLIASADFPWQNPNAAICNAGIVIGTDSVLVIDPFQNAALANLLFATVERLTNKPIRYVLNTHFHFDHTGGNSVAQARGISIIGRGSIRELMVTQDKALDPNPTPPTLIVNSESTIWLGERQVQLHQVEGHTQGTDLVAYVPDANVLFTGDILFHQRIPFIGDGNIRKWQRSLSELIAAYPRAQVMPGHGPVSDSTSLEIFKHYLDNLVNLALSWKEQSLTKAQVLEDFAQVPDSYQDYMYQGLYQSNLDAAYEQITRGSQ